MARPLEDAPARGEDEPSLCPNCGAPRPGHYCPFCGQKEQPLRQNTFRFLRSAINEYFGLDGRLWGTLSLLLFRPGSLTIDHFLGRRARYLAPLRLYLSATLLFFFLISVLDPVAAVQQQMDGSVDRDSTTTVAERLVAIEDLIAASDAARFVMNEVQASSQDSVGLLGQVSLPDSLAEIETGPEIVATLNLGGLDSLADRSSLLEALLDGNEKTRLEWQREILSSYSPDSTIKPRGLADAAVLVFPRPGSTGDDDFKLFQGSFSSRALDRLNQSRTNSERRDAIADFARTTIGQIPLVMFLLLPVYALLLKLIYIRRDWYYSEHLVFALHNHAFAFLTFSLVAALIGFTGGAAWAQTGSQFLMLALIIYALVAQKRTYRQGWIKTLTKSTLLTMVYGSVLMIVGVGLALLLAATVG